MKQSLKSVIEKSNKGYIDNPKDIEQIMNKLMNLSCNELSPIWRRRDSFFCENITKYNGITSDSFENLSYIDVLFLVDEIRNAVYLSYEPPECLEQERIMFVSGLTKLMEISAESNYIIKLFMSINVKAYMDFLEKFKRKNNETESGLFEILRDITYEKQSYIIPNYETIGGLISKMVSYSKKAWKPWTSIEEYEGQIIGCFEVMDFLLIDNIKETYPYLWGKAYDKCQLSENNSDFFEDDLDFFMDDIPF